MRILLATVLAALAAAANATPLYHDGNDLWLTPGESGWGLNIFHQGSTLFATLFVYGQDGRPRWYTASEMMGSDGEPTKNAPATYAGALYESTGPAVGGPFDPSRVTRRQVGAIRIILMDKSNTGKQARVDYTVDGVNVTKIVEPFSFARMNLSGTYVGYQAIPPNVPFQIAPPAVTDDMTITIDQNGSSFVMSTTGSASGSCVYNGTHEAAGHLSFITGQYSCNDARSGGFNFRSVDLTRHGIAGTFRGNRIGPEAEPVYGAMVAARTSAAIRGDGYQTDLWYNPAESGWGLNVIEQGDTIFATLFVYGQDGQPRWYSASNLTYRQCRPPDAASDSNGCYTGELVESTGPFFGTSFNASAVTRRVVGSMTFESFGNNTAFVDYTIDGVTVTRKQVTRATFRVNSMAGTYAAHMTAAGGANDRGVQTGPMSLEVSDTGNAVTMTMRGSRGTCTLRPGTRTQYGQQVMAQGSYDCGGAAIGQLLVYDVLPSWTGFTGAFSLDGFPIGRIEAVRTTVH